MGETIIRVNKSENPYVQIDKFFIDKDERLSWRATGILTYLLAKPNGWEVCITDIVKRKKDGRDAVYAGLKELEDAGYVVREQHRSDGGKFGAYTYIVNERPINTGTSTAYGFTGYGSTGYGSTVSGESDTNNNNIINNKVSKKHLLLSQAPNTLQNHEEEAEKKPPAFEQKANNSTKPKLRRTKTETEDIIPHNEIVEAYHLHCSSLPRVIKVTDARKKQIAARWKENSDISFFADLFQLIEKSDFLTNRGNINRNGWSCTFDWALNDQNMTKILEGRYSNKTIAPAQPQKEPQYSGWGHNVPDYVRQIAEMSARRS